jgi:hypothetical protein
MDESNRIEDHDPGPVWGRPVGPDQAAGHSTLVAAEPGFGADFSRPSDAFVAVPPKKKSSSTLLNVVLGLAVVVAIGGVAFAAGRLTAPAASAANTFTAGAGNGFGNGPRASGAPGNFRGAGFGAGALRGTVTAVTPTAITLTLSSGGTIEIPLDSSTAYHQQAAATSTDVAVGSTVLVELKDQGGAPTVVGPNASLAPGASPGPITVGTATDVTVVAK